MLFSEDSGNIAANNQGAYNSPASKKYEKCKFSNLSITQPFTQTPQINEDRQYSPFVVKSNCYPTLKHKGSCLTENKIKKFSYKFYSPSPNTNKTDKFGDRFIPTNRINLMAKFNMANPFGENTDENLNMTNIDNSSMENNFKYIQMLGQNVLNENNQNTFINQNFAAVKENVNNKMPNKILSFKQEIKPKGSLFDAIINRKPEMDNSNIEGQRKINTKPYKILSAPNLLDDFYLNLVDWSARNDIAAGIRNSVALWSTNQTHESILCSYDNEMDKYVSSIIWSNSGEHLAVGNSQGQIEIYDSKFYYSYFILIIYLSYYSKTYKYIFRA